MATSSSRPGGARSISPCMTRRSYAASTLEPIARSNNASIADAYSSRARRSASTASSSRTSRLPGPSGNLRGFVREGRFENVAERVRRIGGEQKDSAVRRGSRHRQGRGSRAGRFPDAALPPEPASMPTGPGPTVGPGPDPTVTSRRSSQGQAHADDRLCRHWQYTTRPHPGQRADPGRFGRAVQHHFDGERPPGDRWQPADEQTCRGDLMAPADAAEPAPRTDRRE